MLGRRSSSDACGSLSVGPPWRCWGLGGNTVGGLHVVWRADSVSDVWASRGSEDGNGSANIQGALLSFVDGRHNNHRAYLSARHAVKPYQLAFKWYATWILKQFRLVSHIHRAELPAGRYPGKSLAPIE
jgi:fatty-acid desaturase